MMGGPVLRILAMAVVLVALVIPTVSSQPATVDFQFRLSRSEAYFLTATDTMQLNVEMGPVVQQRTFQSQARRVVRILDADAEGTMLVEVTLEEFQVTSDGRTEEQIARPMLVRVRPDGKVVERVIGAMHIDDFPFAFPGRPVRVGDSWTRQTTFDVSGVVGTGTTTITLRGIDVDGGRIAHLEERLDGTVTGAELTKTLPPGVQARVGGTFRGFSQFTYALDRGHVTGSTTSFSIDIQMELTGGGRTTPGTLKLTGTSRESAIERKDIRDPAIAPGLAIVPGKNVGAVSLDLSVADVTRQLGAPTSSHSFRHRSTVLMWPNRLAGHVDPTDPTKLVGLEISDRSYRTEKGIGFGSSQGSVLFGYGMYPTRVNMTDPALGGVQMLIYDEQGIAFAITSDTVHADRGPNHAPVGAVDWITVFPSGGAAKIYPLP